MNEAFYKFCIDKINSASVDELEAELRAHGFDVRRKDNMSEIEKRVLRVVAEQLGLPVGDVKMDHDFVEDLGADSLDLVELAMAVEDEFDVEIPDHQTELFHTAKEVIEYLAKTSGKPIPEEVPVPYDVQELRLYSFVNHYLASGGPHAGIQTGHAAVDLVRKYSADVCGDIRLEWQTEMVKDWADNHKTFIVLNGGMHAEMLRVKQLVEESSWPFAIFHESTEALDGIMTTIVAILPEQVFNMRKVTDTAFNPYYTCSRLVDGREIRHSSMPGDKDFEFIDMLKSKRLAS